MSGRGSWAAHPECVVGFDDPQHAFEVIDPIADERRPQACVVVLTIGQRAERASAEPFARQGFKVIAVRRGGRLAVRVAHLALPALRGSRSPRAIEHDPQ